MFAVKLHTSAEAADRAVMTWSAAHPWAEVVGEVIDTGWCWQVTGPRALREELIELHDQVETIERALPSSA